MAKKIKLGARVEYRDSAGFTKLGLITGTADSIQPNGNVPALGSGEAHLVIHSASGKTYYRSGVSEGTGPNSFSLL